MDKPKNTMVKGPFGGVNLPGPYSSFAAEYAAWWGGASKVPAEHRMAMQHMDELRDRVDLSDGPDTVLAFTGNGDGQAIAHGLGAQPRFVYLLDWQGGAPSVFSAIPDATFVTVTASAGTTGHIAVYK